MRSTATCPTLRNGSSFIRSRNRAPAAVPRSAEMQLSTRAEAGCIYAASAPTRAGFGHAFVPSGIARAMGASPQERRPLPPPGLTRPLSVVARRTTFGRAAEARFRDALRGALANVPGLSPSR